MYPNKCELCDHLTDEQPENITDRNINWGYRCMRTYIPISERDETECPEKSASDVVDTNECHFDNRSNKTPNFCE